MEKFVKRILLLPLWLLIEVALIPYDLFMLIVFDETPLGMELIDWYWD